MTESRQDSRSEDASQGRERRLPTRQLPKHWGRALFRGVSGVTSSLPLMISLMRG